MDIKIPVYTEESGVHRVTIFQGMDDGSFRRTGTQLLREFRYNIQDVGVNEGEIISSRYDRSERVWNTPTALHHYGRPRSLFAFLRSQIKKNKLYVGASSSIHGRIIRFSLHELKFKPTTSRGVRMLATRKYREAIDLNTI